MIKGRIIFPSIYTGIHLSRSNYAIRLKEISQHKSIKWLSLSLMLNNDDKSNEFSL